MIPDALADFVLEFDHFADSYTDLLPMLEKHSNGAFSPTDITEEVVEKSQTELTFYIRGVKHECNLSYTVDDISLIDLANKILKENDSKKTFNSINTGKNQDDIVRMAFIDQETASKAISLGIMPNECD